MMGKGSEMDYGTNPVMRLYISGGSFVGKLEGKRRRISACASAKANCLGDTKGSFKVLRKME